MSRFTEALQGQKMFSVVGCRDRQDKSSRNKSSTEFITVAFTFSFHIFRFVQVYFVTARIKYMVLPLLEILLAFFDTLSLMKLLHPDLPRGALGKSQMSKRLMLLC